MRRAQDRRHRQKDKIYASYDIPAEICELPTLERF